jgi:pyroglutamyl-peptidase
MIKLLLTGFEPFGGYTVNPSDLIAQELNGKSIGNIEIIGKTIPLRYKEICPLIRQHIKEIQPSIIINLGQAPRPSIAFERVAINIVDASKTAYNCETKPKNQYIVEGGDVAYFSSLPIIKLVKNLLDHGIPSYISNTAGTFGCNQIMYCTMNYIQTHLKSNSILAGFIHLPLLPEQTINSPNSAAMSLELISKAIKLTIEFLGK